MAALIGLAICVWFVIAFVQYCQNVSKEERRAFMKLYWTLVFAGILYALAEHFSK